MNNYFQLQFDRTVLTEAMFAFVTDPLPSRNDRPIIHALHDLNPELVDVLECMVLDGTDERQDVADYVEAVFGSGPEAEHRPLL